MTQVALSGMHERRRATALSEHFVPLLVRSSESECLDAK